MSIYQFEKVFLKAFPWIKVESFGFQLEDKKDNNCAIEFEKKNTEVQIFFVSFDV